MNSGTSSLSLEIRNKYIKNIDTGKIREIKTGTFQTSFSGCTCTNSLLEAHYIVYTNTDQNTPTQVIVDITMGDVGLNTCVGTEVIEIKQKFSVKYLTQTENVEIRSGNPGYIIGKPVIFGRINTTNDTMTVFDSGFPLSGTSQSGECLSTDQSISGPSSPIIKFGQEIIYNCYIELTYAELQSYCVDNTDNTLEPIFSSHDLITHIAKFGSINVTNPDDWIEIIIENIDIKPTFNEPTGICAIPNLMFYHVIYSNIGALENPQPKIVYAMKSYNPESQWRFKKKDKTQKQKFYNTVVINFINYEEDTQFYYAPAPNLIPVMPDDIIYPFKISSSTSIVFFIISLILILI